MSLTASITRTAVRIAKLERLEATRAFDRKLISEEDDRAIIKRVVTRPSSPRPNRSGSIPSLAARQDAALAHSAEEGGSRESQAGRQTSRESAMNNDDDYAPDEEAGRALFEEFQNNARAAAERIKYDPWQREYRRVAAEVERTGNQSLFGDFQRRFLMALALLYPPETHARW